MKLKNVIIGGALLLTALVGGVIASSNSAQAGDCSSNAVVRCGTSSMNTVRDRYNNDTTPGTQTIYSHFGLTSNIVNNARVVEGVVTKTNNVVVNGQVVATNAVTAGRGYIPGSTRHVINGTTFYTRSPSVSFRSAQLSAFVFLDGEGRFIGAVIKDCGNPVMGANKVVIKPTYECTSLTARKISRNTYEFVTVTDVKHAEVLGYTYNWGDGNSEIHRSIVQHTYATPGTYTASVKVSVKVDGKVVIAPGNCTTTVVVEAEKCDIPGKEQYPKDDPRCKEDPKDITVCDTRNNTIVTIKENERKSYHSDDVANCKDDPKDIVVCDTNEKKIVTIKEDERKSNHTDNVANCVPKNITVCDTKSKKIVTIKEDERKSYHSDSNKDCTKKPVTVIKTLPKTGASDMAVVGAIIALAAAGVMYTRNNKTARYTKI